MVDVPESVRQRAVARGGAEKRWLADLSDLVAELERHRSITVDAGLRGGSEAYVAAARTADGEDVVAKIGMPGKTDLTSEARMLAAANGRGLVRLLEYDDDRACSSNGSAAIARAANASSIEPWPTPISEPGRSIRRRPYASTGTRTNALRVPGAPAARQPHEYRFIDPDGLFAERAYDLAIPMREWSRELLAGDTVRREVADLSDAGPDDEVFAPTICASASAVSTNSMCSSGP
ncbi:MAG TPA: hypothetical protein VI076_13025 [Actinopolymorphaceae bacterium]